MDYISFILTLGLVFPRLALIIGYYSNGILPNPFPFWIDFFLALFVPRILFITYIALNWATISNPGLWLSLHILFFGLSIVYRQSQKSAKSKD
jgi:hypothetical protein